MAVGQQYLLQILHHTLLCDFVEKSEHVRVCSQEGASQGSWQLEGVKKN